LFCFLVEFVACVLNASNMAKSHTLLLEWMNE
jgi:hypothetical protein